jgi:hypothetical protein
LSASYSIITIHDPKRWMAMLIGPERTLSVQVIISGPRPGFTPLWIIYPSIRICADSRAGAKNIFAYAGLMVIES